MTNWQERLRAAELEQQQKQQAEQIRISAEREASERTVRDFNENLKRKIDELDKGAIGILTFLDIQGMLEKERREVWGQDSKVVPYLKRVPNGRRIIIERGLSLVYEYDFPLARNHVIYKRKWGSYREAGETHASQGGESVKAPDGPEQHGWHDEAVGYNVDYELRKDSLSFGIYVQASDGNNGSSDDVSFYLGSNYMDGGGVHEQMPNIRSSRPRIERALLQERHNRVIFGNLPSIKFSYAQAKLSEVQEEMRHNPHKF